MLNELLLKGQIVTFSDKKYFALICEGESILNNRLLTELSNNPNDMQALTPKHLPLTQASTTLPPGLFAKDDAQQIQYLADYFEQDGDEVIYMLLQACKSGLTILHHICSVRDLALVIIKIYREANDVWVVL